MRRGRALAAVLFAAALMPATATGATVEDNQVAGSFDGTPIVYTLMLPDGAPAENPAPAILLTHGWAGSRQRTPRGFAGDLLEAGGTAAAATRSSASDRRRRAAPRR